VTTAPADRRLLEVVAVALLAVATVGSAWCAYQASQWNGEESRLARSSSEERLEASRQFALATQTIAYDTDVIGMYAEALASDEPELAAFYRESLARPELLPILDRWRAEVQAGVSPGNLLDDDEYMATRLAGYEEASAAAEALSNESEEASRTADQYVLSTVLLAITLFFAGVTTSFRMRLVRILLLAAAGFTMAFAAARLSDLGVL
jgi:hypothetical protein